MRGWAIGLGLAAVLAIPIGIALGSSDFAASAFRVPIEFLRPIPSAALIPLLFLTLGTTLKSEVFLATFGAFWPLLVQTMYGVRDVDPIAIDTARSFRLGRHERLYRITLPSALPYIMTGVRISSTVALILAFTAELFMGTPGLGQRLNYVETFGLNDQIYALALATGFLGVAIHFAVSARREARPALAPVAAEGGDDVSPRALPHAEDRRRDRRADPAPRRLAALHRRSGTTRSSRGRRRSSSSSSKLFLFSQFGTHVVPSLERIGLGFAIAVILGVAIGIPLGLSRIGRSAAMPHIEYWRAIPPPALLPISIILLHSIGNLQKVSFIAFFCIFPVLLNTIDGVRGIEPTLIDTARSYRIPSHERIRRIVFPAALPQIFAGMRTSLALAVIMMVLSEYFASTNGVGYVLLISKNTFQFLPMWAAILLIGVLGYLLNLLFLLVERHVLAWHRGWRAATPQ